jgi:RHS repeat-associated protein
LLSWTRTRVLNANGSLSSTWLINVYYYDKKGRVIQTFKQLYDVGGDAFEKTSYKLDFVGNVVEERTTQTTSSGVFRLGKKYTYDHQDRLLTIKHTFKSKVGSDSINLAEYTHVANNYNEVGLLSKKELHNSVQKQNYKYTPRSWMASTINEGGKAYSVTLDYNANGNIKSLAWQTPGANNSGNLSNIVYDEANRFTGTTGGTLEEYGIKYDKNGNIKELKRGNIDDLTYTYTGNVLTKVTDTKTYEGFDNGASGDTTDYYYDSNGNLTFDRNKKISSINYNLLNLPREVTLKSPTRTVQYFYDASGAKVKTAHPNGTTLYAGAFEYNASGMLQRIALEEGQLVKNGNSYEVNYYLRDHLGNVRMVLKQNGDVLQETQYYPFGLAVTKTGTDAQNKYLYNGKEKQPETAWLDYGARMYMPEIGRWGVVDPMAELDFNFSPYTYVYNSPLGFVDHFGMHPDSAANYAQGAVVENNTGGWKYLGDGNWETL